MLTPFLVGRLRFQWGNAFQAALFLIPHVALLAVDRGLWPLLAAQAVTGWTMGWLRCRTGSIGPAVLVHGVVNIGVGLLMGG